MTRRHLLKTLPAAAVPVQASGAEPPLAEYSRGGMRYRRLGRTEMFVSALGFGSHTDYQLRIRGPNGGRLTDEYQVQRTRQTERAIELGVNLVDVYDEAGQYEPLARLVKGKRDKVLVATKFNEFPGHIGAYIDRAARLFGHVDLGRYVVRDDLNIPPETLENWDLMRKAKAAGKIRAIGFATHSPEVMLKCLDELEGVEFVFLPFNFIHARASYTRFFPEAGKRGIGLVGMKPLASGSIVRLDPRRPRPEARTEGRTASLNRPRSGLLDHAVARLINELERSPEETLAQAALKFVFAQPEMSCTLAGMFLSEELEENYRAFASFAKARAGRSAALFEAARDVAALSEKEWLPEQYRWLDERWSA